MRKNLEIIKNKEYKILSTGNGIIKATGIADDEIAFTVYSSAIEKAGAAVALDDLLIQQMFNELLNIKDLKKLKLAPLNIIIVLPIGQSANDNLESFIETLNKIDNNENIINISATASRSVGDNSFMFSCSHGHIVKVGKNLQNEAISHSKIFNSTANTHIR